MKIPIFVFTFGGVFLYMCVPTPANAAEGVGAAMVVMFGVPVLLICVLAASGLKIFTLIKHLQWSKGLAVRVCSLLAIVEITVLIHPFVLISYNYGMESVAFRIVAPLLIAVSGILHWLIFRDLANPQKCFQIPYWVRFWLLAPIGTFMLLIAVPTSFWLLA